MNTTPLNQMTGIDASLKPGAKILFANFPGDGHFNPLTGLAAHLKSLGHDVRWYTSSTYAPKIKKLAIHHYPFKNALDVTGENIDELFAERKKYKSQVAKLNFDFKHLFILRAPEYYADIQDIYQSFPFDLLIADIAFTAIPLVIEHMGIPAVAVGIVPLTETSKDLPPAGLGLTPSTSVAGKLKEKVLHYVADNILFKESYNVMKTIFSKYGIKPDGNLFDTITRKASLVLQSGSPGFEYHRSDLGKNIRFIGPLLPYQGKTKTEKWFDDKLLAYKKVVLVTQGTVERDINKIIVPTLEAFKNTDHLVIVTTGGTGTKELRTRYPAPNIIIEDFISFADVMPYADVYVTNGGYGGVLLSIQNKLPMVVAGVHEGKNEINARIGYFKLGVNLKTELPKPEQIKKAVEEVLNNKVYAENVTKLSEEFTQYNPQQLCAQYIEQLLQPVWQMRRQYEEAIY